MTTSHALANDEPSELPPNHPPIVSREAWEARRQQMLLKEKAHTRAGDALAAERRRMPWMEVEKTYEFEGSRGKVSLLGLFEGRRQLIVYRAFFEPGVHGWPEHRPRATLRAGPTSDGTGATATSSMHLPDPEWIQVSAIGEAAFRCRDGEGEA